MPANFCYIVRISIIYDHYIYITNIGQIVFELSPFEVEGLWCYKLFF